MSICLLVVVCCVGDFFFFVWCELDFEFDCVCVGFFVCVSGVLDFLVDLVVKVFDDDDFDWFFFVVV